MVIKEIQEYAQIRAKARAYLCYLMNRHLSNVGLTASNLEEHIEKQLQKLKGAIPHAEVLFAIDANGLQIADNVSKHSKLAGKRKGIDRSDRAYFYKTLKERRCVLTDPYPSLETNNISDV